MKKAFKINIYGAGAVILAVLMAAGCGRFGGPKTFDEAMIAARSATATGDLKRVYDMCGRAFEFADTAGNGNQAILALECYADAAGRVGKTATTLPAFAKVIEKYPRELLVSVGRFRLRNDYGVALYQAGKEAEAIAVLDEALTVYKGTARAGLDTMRDRMHLVRNLGKIYKKQGVTPAATAFANEWAEEIEAQMGRSGNQYGSRMGAGTALEVLADIISATDSIRAGQVRALAMEQQDGEAGHAASNPGSAKRCHNIEVIGGQLQRCFADLP